MLLLDSLLALLKRHYISACHNACSIFALIAGCAWDPSTKWSCSLTIFFLSPICIVTSLPHQKIYSTWILSPAMCVIGKLSRPCTLLSRLPVAQVCFGFLLGLHRYLWLYWPILYCFPPLGACTSLLLSFSCCSFPSPFLSDQPAFVARQSPLQLVLFALL